MSEPERPTLQELRGIDLFDELDDEQLALWQEVAVVREAPAETTVADANDDCRQLPILGRAYGSPVPACAD